MNNKNSLVGKLISINIDLVNEINDINIKTIFFYDKVAIPYTNITEEAICYDKNYKNIIVKIKTGKPVLVLKEDKHELEVLHNNQKLKIYFKPLSDVNKRYKIVE